MEYLIGAVIGAILFFGGYLTAYKLALRKKDEPDDDLQVQYDDTRRTRADKMNMQMYNMLNYTGRAQNDDYED